MVRISVKMHPGSSRRYIEIRDDGVHLYTTSKPLQGRANREACEMLADYFKFPKKEVSLFRGERSRQKVFQIEASIGRLQSSMDPVLADKIIPHVREV